MQSDKKATSVQQAADFKMAWAASLKLFTLGTRDIPLAGFAAMKNTILTLVKNPRALQQEFVFVALGEFLVQSFRHAGPVFVKLGQILAARDDLLPKALCNKLTELYDKQPAVSFGTIQRTVRAAYTPSPFASINPEPLGVGSVGQVHRARLHDGTDVVIKVIKPGAEQAAQADLELLLVLTKLLQALAPQARSAEISYLQHALDDLADSLRREFDLRNECMNLLKFKERCRKNTAIYIPDSYPSLSTKNILVMEYVDGVPLGKIADVGGMAENKRHLAQVLLKELLEQVFEAGHFHADPHAGNLLLLPDGRIAFIDLGLTGEMTREAKARLVAAMRALLARNPDQAMDALLGFAIVPENFDRKAFRENIARVYRNHTQKKAQAAAGTKLAGAGVEQLVQDLFKEAHAAGLYVPEATTLFIKAMVTVEAVARSIDPQVNITKTVATTLAQSALKNLFAKFRQPQNQ